MIFFYLAALVLLLLVGRVPGGVVGSSLVSHDTLEGAPGDHEERGNRTRSLDDEQGARYLRRNIVMCQG